MSRVNSASGSHLHPFEFDDATFTQIGKLIRVCADLEDALTVYIARMTNVAEATVGLLMGKSAISTRQRIAQTITASISEADLAACKQFFGEGFSACLSCRNAVAHGMLLGQNDHGQVCFAIQETVPGENYDILLVRAYEPTAFGEFAVKAKETLDEVGRQLQLDTLREKRRTQPLDPYRKSRQQARARGGPVPPPQSSPQ